MKKVLAIVLSLTMIFVLASCNSGGASSNSTSTTAAQTTTKADRSEAPESDAAQIESTTADTNDDHGILVTYFTYSGNTEKVANMIAEETNGTLFKIETETPYPESYDETVDQAKEEQNNGARPALSTHVENMDDYNVIYLGYPNWWGTMPMAMFTFLEEYDFSGKTIIPFCTHGGSALGSSESDIANLCPNATMLEGLAIRDTTVDNAAEEVKNWIGSLSFA